MNRQSIEAYYDLKWQRQIGAMQQEVLSLVHLNPGRTARELAEIGHHPDPNVVRPRIVELHELGLIEGAGVRICRVSGKAVMTWRIKSYEPQKELF
jgi:hypothetical protein